MSNVVTSFARKLTSGRQTTEIEPRHRRDGFFDESGTWHDAADEAPVLANGIA